MSAEPITRAEREGLAAGYVYVSPETRARYDATIDLLLAALYECADAGSMVAARALAKVEGPT